MASGAETASSYYFISSLIDSYEFKENGLLKNIITITGS